MKFFKSTRDLPGHPEGDTLAEVNIYYMWEHPPHYYIPKELVENNHDFFYEINLGFEQGEDIWYVSLTGLIITEQFDERKHKALREYGNLFKTEMAAIAAKDEIEKIFSSKD